MTNVDIQQKQCTSKSLYDDLCCVKIRCYNIRTEEVYTATGVVIEKDIILFVPSAKLPGQCIKVKLPSIKHPEDPRRLCRFEEDKWVSWRVLSILSLKPNFRLKQVKLLLSNLMDDSKLVM